jgi:hypothetical protein
MLLLFIFESDVVWIHVLEIVFVAGREILSHIVSRGCTVILYSEGILSSLSLDRRILSKLLRVYVYVKGVAAVLKVFWSCAGALLLLKVSEFFSSVVLVLFSYQGIRF